MQATFRLLSRFSRGGGGFLRATPVRLTSPDEYASVTQLRQRLQQQLALGAPRMTSLDTESRLTIELSRSHRGEDREEALDRAEELWSELNDKTVPVTTPTRTAMRVNLCSAMRRCALISRDRPAADLWTQRFAERTMRLSPTDFLQTAEQQEAWEDASKKERVRPGTGITAEDLAADAREAAEQSGSSEAMASTKKKKDTPMQDFRHNVFLEHPSFDYAFRHGRNYSRSPGPRYTG